MEKKLEVKDLVISFRTVNGRVQAVRDISFDLYKGETLAIVGESGSGKSVTSRAIMGILAGNAIVEGGEILYDGKDLLKVPEEEMHKLRGDKIAMIFQDPLSSLDPIVKIGKQITEAMLLKNKANRRASRREFNTMLSTLRKNIEAAVADESATEKIKAMTETFDKFNIEAITLENRYNVARTAAEELIAEIEDFLFRAEKKQKLDARFILGGMSKKLKAVKDPFLTAKYDSLLEEHASTLVRERESLRATGDLFKGLKNKIKGTEAEIDVPESVVESLHSLKQTLEKLLAETRPNFFRIGFYLYKNPNAELGLSEKSIEEINEDALKYLDENFMKEFIDFEVKGVRYSFEKSLEMKKKVVENAEDLKNFFRAGNFEKADAERRCGGFSLLVEDSIDRLAVIKDSNAYTFRQSLTHAVERYFYYKKNNPKEEARFDRQTKKRDALIAKGKKVDWKVVPKVVVDLDEQIANILSIVDRLTQKYVSDIQAASSADYQALAVELIDFLKEKASQVVYRVTKRIAREKAVKLMEEVGIPEPRIRYNQYPFEFSGGMRQRIVIAIALAANPDILICDEPTTALDVTIQSQILELINKLKEERKLSVIFITHDLGVVANMADKIAVMYAGKIVEYGTADDIFYDSRHPYTWALLSSMPDLDTDEKLDAIPGTPPNMIYPPVGDAFAERNKYALKIDFEMEPPKFEVSPTHWAATWLLHPDAPKVPVPKAITDRIQRMKKLGGAEHGEQ